MVEESLSLRARNKESRRDRILAEARGIIARGGADTLNLRDLAKAAGVTVPTIYNLIGSKEDVLVALFRGGLHERVQVDHLDDPLDIAEALALQTVEIFAADEEYYRAAFLAVEHVHRMQSRPQSVTQLYYWGDHLLNAGVEACSKAGLLRGRIAPCALAALVKRSFRENLYNWANGEISLERFRGEALADLYITLCADAVDTFAALLIQKTDIITATLAREGAAVAQSV